MNVSIKNGVLIALAAGSLFATACKKKEANAGAGEKTSTIKCMGVNECKGHGSCKTAHNACAGKNGCKGQGATDLTEASCKDKGGTLAEM